MMAGTSPQPEPTSLAAAPTCTKRDHIVPGGGIREPLDERKYRCACGLVLVTGTGVVEIRFGLIDHLYPTGGDDA